MSGVYSTARGVTELQRRLLELWRDVVGEMPIDLDEDFFASGGDSFAAADLATRIQKALGCPLPANVVYEAPTLRRLANFLLPVVLQGRSPLIDLCPPSQPRPLFFCVHGIGGEVEFLKPLARHLGAHQPFRGIAASPRTSTTRVTIEGMAAEYLTLVRARQPNGPYCLGGYSMGASVAFEMACQLRQQGQDVGLLAIIDHCPPPIRYRPARPTPGRVLRFMGNTVDWLRDDLYPARASWRRLVSLARRVGRTFRRPDPRAPEASLLFDLDRMNERVLAMIATNYQALQDYRPSVYPGPVVLFRARTQPLFRCHDRDLGWGALAGGGVLVVRLPGNHETIVREPHVAALARELGRRLEEVAAKG